MSDAIPVMRPQLPRAEALLPYLHRVDEARYYSNHGQLVRELERRLDEHFSTPHGANALSANGTVALSAALLAVGGKPGQRCLLPAWTFVGSAAAVYAANMEPYFVDVDEATWMLDPGAIEARADLDGVGAVMVVSAFGAPVDVAAWDAFTQRTSIPVIIDCAASFDTVASMPQARPGRSPIMISLHATKAFGVGEGAIVVSHDLEMLQRFRQICNFGVWNTPAQILGYNGKLSEYHAAVGLAMLDMWPVRRRELEALTMRYRESLQRPTMSPLPSYGEGWVSCYANVRTVEPAETLVQHFKERGIETRRWWQRGVQVQEAYRRFGRDELPVTEDLASHVVGLPFFHDMDKVTYGRIEAALDDYDRGVNSTS